MYIYTSFFLYIYIYMYVYMYIYIYIYNIYKYIYIYMYKPPGGNKPPLQTLVATNRGGLLSRDAVILTHVHYFFRNKTFPKRINYLL